MFYLQKGVLKFVISYAQFEIIMGLMVDIYLLCVCVCVCFQFMEKLPKGGCVFRTVEMEEKARRKHEERRQSLGEKLCSQLQAEMEKEEESASECVCEVFLQYRNVESRMQVWVFLQ